MMAVSENETSRRIKQKQKDRGPRRKVPAIEFGQRTCSPAQAAAAAGVAISTIWLWLNGNKLASRSVGGRRLINVASLYGLIGTTSADSDRREAE